MKNYITLHSDLKNEVVVERKTEIMWNWWWQPL